MAFEIEIIEEGSQSEKDYNAFLDTCKYSFIQQSTIWRDVIKDLGPDEPYLLLAREGSNPVGALPLYLYRGKFGNIMTSVPQPGPLGGIACDINLENKETMYKILIDYAVGLAREKNCCLFTVITSPFVSDSELYRRFMAPEYELENFTQYIALEEMFDDKGIARYMSKRNIVKRKIENARAEGIGIKESTSLSDFDTWYEIHATRHRELGIRPLEKKLFMSIIEKAVPQDRAKFLVAWYNKTIIGGCFYIYNKSICDAFLMSANSEFIELGTNYALTDSFLKWANENNKQIFNWQSSPSRSGGVYEFKRRWGSKEAVYYFLTKVVGDISGIMSGNFGEVREAYKNHFLLPCKAAGDTNIKTFGEFVKSKVRKQ